MHPAYRTRILGPPQLLPVSSAPTGNRTAASYILRLMLPLLLLRRLLLRGQAKRAPPAPPPPPLHRTFSSSSSCGSCSQRQPLLLLTLTLTPTSLVVIAKAPLVASTSSNAHRNDRSLKLPNLVEHLVGPAAHRLQVLLVSRGLRTLGLRV